jgi:GGDEF domain-containing protein
VWTFAAALTLPLAFAATVAVIVQAYGWLRSGEARAPLYKHVYSTASVGLACGAASLAAVAGGGLGSVVIPVALLGYTGETDIGVMAERIRERVAGLVVDVTTVDGAARIRRLPVSVGGALHPGGRADLDGLLRIADTAQYAAKRAGRNQVRMGRA